MLKRLTVACAFFLSACTQTEAPPPAIDANVNLEKLSESVWVHTSFYEFPGGGIVPSNGLAVVDGDGLILVDTAWGEIATKILAQKLKAETGLEIKKVVITHYHYDRLAGVDWLEAQGVTAFTHPDTPVKSAAVGMPVPNTSVAALKAPGSRTAIGPIEVAYPGPAHTDDNLMVYVKADNILFGGCAVRAGSHTGLGNIEDADLFKWGPSVAWAKRTYKDTRIVVPSHGKVGNAKLLDHTLALVAKAVNSKSEPGPSSETEPPAKP